MCLQFNSHQKILDLQNYLSNLKKQIDPVKLKTNLELDGEFGGVRSGCWMVLSTPSGPLAVGRAAGVEVASGASA